MPNETNQNPTPRGVPMPKTRVQLSHAKFYRACQALTEARDEFAARRSPVPEVAETLSERLGFTVTKATVRKLKAATNVSWATSQKTHKSRGTKTHNDIATLARCVVRLHETLGVPLPGGLVKVCERRGIALGVNGTPADHAKEV